MSILLFLYLIDVLANISCLIGLYFVISGLVMVATLIYGFMENKFKDYKEFEDSWEKRKNQENQEFRSRFYKVRNIFIVACILLSFSCFIPDKSTMYIMAGTYVAQESDISQKILKAINDKLDEELNNIAEKKE